MLNLRAIGIRSGKLGVTSSTTLRYSDIKFATCHIVGNLGAPVGIVSAPISSDSSDDYDSQALQDVLHLEEVLDDPLMEGIAMEMD